ncbi:MAG: hypothetical protein J7J51_01450 [Candidatus Omnitrophica bacterium]|nr:hypothetical protein [Candidatus Omnitrophota bacterium]
MKRINLTQNEKQIENALLKGENIDVTPKEFKNIAKAPLFAKKIRFSMFV